MSNRKAHRRERSFRRHEAFIQHRLRRPNRSDRAHRQVEIRRDRRAIWKLIAQLIAEASA